jgi:hypothetical protein
MHHFYVNFIIRRVVALEERYNFCSPIFAMYRRNYEHNPFYELDRRCFESFEEHFWGSGSPFAADLASKSACSLSPLRIFFTENLSKEVSILQTVSRYFSSFESFALLLLSTWPVITWESDLSTVLLIPMALSFRSPNNTALYSAMLFVHLNSSLTA